MKRAARRVAAVFGLTAVIAGAALSSLWIPYRGFEGEIFVRFERGAGTPAIAQKLASEGVIRYPWQFWVARLIAPGAKLQAGEYRFDSEASVRQIFARLRRGDIYHFDFTVPEGSNIFDIAQSLERDGVMTADDFLAAASNPVAILDLAPRAKTLEGYLFPSTYRLSHSTTAAELCSMMTNEFRKNWKKLAAGSADNQRDPHRTVTLASLVEKETGVADERALIAGVFENRLRVGIRLGCDPTVIYAALLEQRYRGTIFRSDLDSHSPYNTYQHDGLPPGPIANPGAASLTAALRPAETDFLYFVAKPGGGGHVFSSTLAAHEKAVQNYRHGAQTKAAKTRRKAG